MSMGTGSAASTADTSMTLGKEMGFKWFQQRGGDQRKTVTFGDASAIRSKPFWSMLSLILILAFWWFSTTAFGFPESFKSEVDEKFQVAADEAEAKNADRIEAGNPNLVAVPAREPLMRDYLAACATADDAVCSDAEYSQLVNPRTLPSPGDTWAQFNRLRTTGFQGTTLWEHAGISLWRVLRGMFWGILFGVPIGFAMGLSSRLRGFFDTPVEGFRTIPPLAILPLFILWFGIGDGTAVRLLIFASIWIMIIAARAGAATVQLSKVRAAYSLGASKWQVLRRVILPNALPELFTGARVALGVSWGTLVAAELVGAETGLGAMIFTARNFLRTDVVLVGIIVIAVIGVIMDVIMRWLEARLIPWRGKG